MIKKNPTSIGTFRTVPISTGTQCFHILYGTICEQNSVQQGCGSAFILCGSGFGSSSFSEWGSGSGSRSRSSLTKFEEKKSWRVFLSCKKQKRLLKSKKQWSLCKFTFFKLNKDAVISNFLAFFQFLVDKFTLLDLDPHIECWSGSVSKRENECGSMRIRIHSPGVQIGSVVKNLNFKCVILNIYF